MGKKKRASEASNAGAAEPAPFNNPFGALGGLQVEASAPREPTPSAQPTPEPEPAPGPYVGTLVISRERKGHGGKTITRLQGVALSVDDLTQLARELGRALGTGARVDGADIAISGDQRDRLADWLREQGANRVVVGN